MCPKIKVLFLFFITSSSALAADIRIEPQQEAVYISAPSIPPEQSAYEASRAALDQQPMIQDGVPHEKRKGEGIWGTLGSMLPSGGGGKCRGVCY